MSGALTGVGSLASSVQASGNLVQQQNQVLLEQGRNSVLDQVEISREAIDLFLQTRDLPRGEQSLTRPNIIADQIAAELDVFTEQSRGLLLDLTDEERALLEALEEAIDDLNLSARVSNAAGEDPVILRAEIGRLKSEALQPSTEVDLDQAPRSVQALSRLQELEVIEDRLERREASVV